MWEWLLEAARHVASARPAVVAMVQPPSGGGTEASQDQAQCIGPRYSYGDWERTGEDRWYEGEWVMQRLHYQRTRTDTCDDSETTEHKIEGPFRLWQAVPDQRIAGVNHPNGDTGDLEGAPFKSSKSPAGWMAEAGPNGASGGDVANAPSPPGGARSNNPYMPSLALLAGLLVATVRHKWDARGYETKARNTGSFLWGFVKGAVVALVTIAVVATVAALFSISTPVLLTIAAVLVIGGGIASYLHRKKQQEANGIRPNVLKTVGVAALDALGLSGVIEGVTGKRMLTGEQLDPEVAGESLGAGMVQVAALGVGARTLPKGLGRVSAASSESILSRLSRTLSGWLEVRKAPEGSLTGVWQVLGAVGDGAGFGDVMAKLPAPLRTLTLRLVEAKWLTLGEDGVLRGPAGTVALSKVREALISNNLRRLRNIYNNVKGGEAQLLVRKSIEGDGGFVRFVADFRDPSAGGLDAIVEMNDGTFHIVEVKGQESAVGPNDVYKVLQYRHGKNGQSGEADIHLDMLRQELLKRVKDPMDFLRIDAALRRGDGSVVLRVELVGTNPTGRLNGLNEQVIRGVKIIVNPPLR